MPDPAPAAPAAPAPAAPAAPAAPSTPPAAPAAPPASLTPPSADQSLLGQPGTTPAAGDFKYVGDDGNFVPEWNTHLPEDFGDFRTKLGNYKNPVELAKALHSANQTIGKKGLILPTKDSSAEEVAAFRKAMGVPETPKGYLEKAPKTPEGLPFDEGIALNYMEVAHKHNIPAEAMAELMALNLQQVQLQEAAGRQQLAEIKDKGTQQLRQVWGRDFVRNMDIAEKAVALVNGNPNTYGFRDPEAVRVIVALASKLDEDVLVQGGESLPAGVHGMHAAAIDIIQNPQNKDYAAYHGKGRPPDTEVRARVRRMLQQSEPVARK